MKKLNLLNNLNEITGQQGGIIHHYLNLKNDDEFQFFTSLNSYISINGLQSKDYILNKAKEFNVIIKNL